MTLPQLPPDLLKLLLRTFLPISTLHIDHILNEHPVWVDLDLEDMQLGQSSGKFDLFKAFTGSDLEEGFVI